MYEVTIEKYVPEKEFVAFGERMNANSCGRASHALTF